MDDLCSMFESFLKIYEADQDQDRINFYFLACCLDEVSRELSANRSAPHEQGERRVHHDHQECQVVVYQRLWSLALTWELE